MALLPVLRDVSAAMARRVPGLRVVYGPAQGAQQGYPALIWELQGGPIKSGYPNDGDRHTIALRYVTAVAELRGHSATSADMGAHYEATEELLRRLVQALQEVCPADYSAAEDWSRNMGAGVTGASAACCRVAVQFVVKLSDDPWGRVEIDTAALTGQIEEIG